jgi:hypothetical protein
MVRKLSVQHEKVCIKMENVKQEKRSGFPAATLFDVPLSYWRQALIYF